MASQSPTVQDRNHQLYLGFLHFGGRCCVMLSQDGKSGCDPRDERYGIQPSLIYDVQPRMYLLEMYRVRREYSPEWPIPCGCRSSRHEAIYHRVNVLCCLGLRSRFRGSFVFYVKRLVISCVKGETLDLFAISFFINSTSAIFVCPVLLHSWTPALTRGTGGVARTTRAIRCCVLFWGGGGFLLL
jgi:hypothetical protein